MPRCFATFCLLVVAALFATGCNHTAVSDKPDLASPNRNEASVKSAPIVTPLHVVVMDPMAEPLSCACVDGMGQRKYYRLAQFLEFRTGRTVQLIFEESLNLAIERIGRNIDLIIGKQSVVRFDAHGGNFPVRLIAMMSDRKGRTDLTGVLLVRKNDPAKNIADLKGRTIMLGPIEDQETHSVARQFVKENGCDKSTVFKTAANIEGAALAVLDNEADAAFVPDFMPAFLEACGKVEPGSMRVIGQTAAVPFVGVFVSNGVTETDEQVLRDTLDAVAENPKLLDALESKLGFVDASKKRNDHPENEKVATAVGDEGTAAGWTDWRGPGRTGLSTMVPKTLPDKPAVKWTIDLTGPAMAPIGMTEEYVVVPDKDAELQNDVIRCFDSETGKGLWTVKYSASGKLKSTNAPRAAPVIHDGNVYVQSALGDLHCVELETGRVIWRVNLLDQFSAEPLMWGYCVPPLVVDEKLIVAPGSPKVSIAALDLKTGEILWTTPGNPAAYAAFIVNRFGRKRQIVGYDAIGLGGWNIDNGKRLWEMVPPRRSDYNVGTPVVVGDRVLVATENNGARLYEFSNRGEINQDPVAVNNDLTPDSCTPVVLNGRVFGSGFGELYCLDLGKGLQTIWSVNDDLYYDHTNLIAGNDRVLIWNTEGDLILIRADTDVYQVVSHIRPFADEDVESLSHPALMGDRLVLRSGKRLLCLSLIADAGQ